MPRRDDFFIESGLIAPPPSYALSELFETLVLRHRHPVAIRLGWTKEHELWALHRVLFNTPDCIVELLESCHLEEACPEQCIPLPREILAQVRVCWQMWYDMAALGIDTDSEVEPVLPVSETRRVRGRVLRPEDDD